MTENFIKTCQLIETGRKAAFTAIHIQRINYCRAGDRTGVSVLEGRHCTNRFMNAACAAHQVRTRAGPVLRQLFKATSGVVRGIQLMPRIHTHSINHYVTLFVEFVLIWSFLRDTFI